MEDGKIFDYEKDWQIVNHGNGKAIFVNKSIPSFYRIMDFENETYIFSDTARVKRIRDINKILAKEDDENANMAKFKGLVNSVLDETYPIEIPYIPQTLTAFIEAFPGFENYDDTLGILYFRDETNGIEDAEMIECKRYFRIPPKPLPFEEINEKIYNDVKQKWIRREDLKDE